MAVGKGRTARRLSALSGRFAIDTDDLIESFSKKKIRKIFSEHGEQAFRKLEQETANWIERSVTGTIVSTGGGFFGVHNLQKLGTVIYLHADLESIIDSVKRHPNSQKKIKKRPLLQNFQKAAKLYEKRVPLYRSAAHHEVTVQGRDLSETAIEILQLCS